ncbi:MAG: phosphodiesterase [Magnetococcus sp. XQGC-1]
MSQPPLADQPLRILHFSDCHLFADPERELYGVRPAPALAATLELARAQATRSHLAIVTGDLTQDGEPGAYRRAEEMFAGLQMPVYALPGNHDLPEEMQRNLTGRPISWLHALVVGGWRLLFLDSTIPGGGPDGALPEERLATLAESLQQQPALPTLVAMHHQPIPVATPWMNRMALAKPEALFQVLARYPGTRCLLFGHIHHPLAEAWQGIPLLSAPSTCVQFAMGTEEPVFIRNTTGFRWLTLYPDGTLDTGVVWR